jgi:hypothetical protein
MKLQSIVAIEEVFSQLSESANHIWSEDLYVETHCISR